MGNPGSFGDSTNVTKKELSSEINLGNNPKFRVVEGTPEELTGRDMIKLLPPTPSKPTKDLDESIIYLMKQSRDTAIELGNLLDSKQWKYIKFEHMVEIERKADPDKIIIKLEINIMATVQKVAAFLQNAEKMEETDTKCGEIDTLWKIGDHLEISYHKMKYDLPGGHRDFALGVRQYNLNDKSIVIVKHSIDPDFSSSKENKIPKTNGIRGELDSLTLIQRNTDKSSIINVVIVLDLKGKVDKEDIKDIEEANFEHYCNIKKALENDK